MPDRPTPPPGDRPTPPPRPRNEYRDNPNKDEQSIQKNDEPLYETRIVPPVNNLPPDGHSPPPINKDPQPVAKGPDSYTYNRRPRRPVPITNENHRRTYPSTGHPPSHTNAIDSRKSPDTIPPRRRPPSIDHDKRPLPPEGASGHLSTSRNNPIKPTNPVRNSNTDSSDEENKTTSVDHRIDGKRPKRRARRRSQMAAIYIFIIVAAVCIGLTSFAMAFPRMFDPDRHTEITATPSPTPTPTPLPLNTRNIRGMVTAISDQHVTMLDIANDRTRHFTLTDDTSINNRFGNEMDPEYLFVGHVMDVAYDPDTHRLFSLRQAFTRDITPADFRVDIDNSTITVGNDIFTFTSQTLILHRGTPFLLADISPDDTVTMVILDGIIWLIEVAYGHGFLEFTNIDDVIEGRVILDPLGQGIHRFANLEDRVALAEGQYRVTVEGRNIEAFVAEVDIVQGQTTTIDLAEVEPSAAVLELTVSPSGSRVYINGALTSLHAALEFEFGESVTIRVERDGYYTYERTADMNQAVVSIHITLEEETPEPSVGNLFVFSMPAGAQVWVNNQLIGTTPTAIELEPGVHSVSASLVGFYDYNTVINVSEGENSLTLIMTPFAEDPYEFIPIPTPPPEDDPWQPPDDDPYDHQPGYGYGDDD